MAEKKGSGFLSSIPLIGAGLNLIGNIIGGGSQRRENTRQMAWQERMYDRQRADALADFHMQNDYNSPAAQMQRLRTAGLNPNLIYGGSTGLTDAAPIRSSNPGSVNPKAFHPDFSGATSSLFGYADLRMKAAQTDQIEQLSKQAEEQTKLLAAQQIATLAGAKKTAIDTDRGKLDLAIASAVQNYTIEQERLKTEQLKVGIEKTTKEIAKIAADTTYTVDENVRKAAMNKAQISQIAADILVKKAQEKNIKMSTEAVEQGIKNSQLDYYLKYLEIELKQKGLTWSDPYGLRLAQALANTISVDKEGKMWFKPPNSNKAIEIPAPDASSMLGGGL